MKPSQQCFDLVMSFEGRRLLAYDDARPDYALQEGDQVEGTLTIGHGHTGPAVYIGLVWSQEQADAQFAVDLQEHTDQMARLVTVGLTQGQIDALTSFTFQEGSGRLEASTLLRLLNAGSYAAVPDQLCRQDEGGNWHGYVFVRGKVNAQLVRRRQAEIALWNAE